MKERRTKEEKRRQMGRERQCIIFEIREMVEEGISRTCMARRLVFVRRSKHVSQGDSHI